MSPDAVYVAYWSLLDPLCQSQSLPVVRALARDKRPMALVTFEQPRWSLDPESLNRTQEDLRGEGIFWVPLRYHKRPRLAATLLDILNGAWACSRATGCRGARLYHGRGTVAAAVAHLGARLGGARFLNDADGPLSDEYADAGLWRRGSVAHRLTRSIERHLIRAADAVIVLTSYRREEIASFTQRRVTVVPCGVDTDLFRFREEARRENRARLGLAGTVLVYAGKAGGWYLTDAMLDFVAVASRALGRCSLLVLTNDDPTEFEKGAAARGIACTVKSATRRDMPGLLSAADVGLSFILSASSKAAASPVKNGEYLSCGLPVLTTPGIGDYSDLIRRRRVGVVVPRLDTAAYEDVGRALAGLLRDSTLQQRCRETALSEVSLVHSVLPRYRDLYDSLLNPQHGETG